MGDNGFAAPMPEAFEPGNDPVGIDALVAVPGAAGGERLVAGSPTAATSRRAGPCTRSSLSAGIGWTVQLSATFTADSGSSWPKPR